MKASSMPMVARCIISLAVSGPAWGQVPPTLSALCPKALPGEIVVCADAEPPKSPYRLPLPTGPDPEARSSISVSRERNALFDHDAGGMHSCSASGASGGAGCGFKRHKAWVEQRAGAKDPRGWIFSEAPK